MIFVISIHNLYISIVYYVFGIYVKWGKIFQKYVAFFKIKFHKLKVSIYHYFLSHKTRSTYLIVMERNSFLISFVIFI